MLLVKNSSEDIAQKVATENTDFAFKKTQAKALRMVSHNPQTQAHLYVNADKAVQYDDKITLNNPIGTFEKPEGPTSLKSIKASYYEADREVHFFEKVSFDHYSGFTATTIHAILNTQTQDISGNQGIKAFNQETKFNY